MAAKIDYQQICGTEERIRFGKLSLKHGLHPQKDTETSKNREEMAILLNFNILYIVGFYIIFICAMNFVVIMSGGESVGTDDIKVIFQNDDHT